MTKSPHARQRSRFRKGSVWLARERKRQSAKLDNDRQGDSLAVESAFIRANVDRKWIDTEDALELATLCWPEYSNMSPFTRTELFVAEYQKLHPEKYRQWKGADRDRGPYQDRWVENDQADVTAFYGARISADMLGMPYYDYIRLAFDAMCDGYPDRKYLPKPGQLQITLENGEVLWWVDKVLERWALEGNDARVREIRAEDAPKPDCFGMVESGRFAACAGCVFVDACTNTRMKASGRLMELYGSIDPRGDLKRAQTRNRVAAHRRRKAELAALEQGMG